MSQSETTYSNKIADFIQSRVIVFGHLKIHSLAKYGPIKQKCEASKTPVITDSEIMVLSLRARVVEPINLSGNDPQDSSHVEQIRIEI